MKFSSLATAAAAGALALSAGSGAIAATQVYEFGGNGPVCETPTDETAIPQCAQATAATPLVPDLTAPPAIAPDAPTVTLLGASIDSLSPVFLNQFNFGATVGDRSSPGQARIGANEGLFVTFSETVTLVGFEIGAFNDVDQTGRVQVVGDAGSITPFTYNNVFAGAGTQESFAASLTGTEFLFTQVNANVGGSGNAGFGLYSVTIEYEDRPPSEVPVPPALPMLGGALALLAWRARKARA